MIENSVKTRWSCNIGFIKIWYLMAMLNLSLSIDIIISQNNKNKDSQTWIEEAKKQLGSVIDWHRCNYSSISQCISTYPASSIILDLSDDFETQLSLSHLCKENKKIHLVTQKRYSYSDGWTFSIIPSSSAQMDAYFAALNYFSWTQGLAITDEDNIYSKQKFLEYSANFDYLTIESSANIENLVSRVIKPLGATLYYIFTNSDLSLKIQQALKSKKLLMNGDGIILNQNSGYNCTIDGALVITAAGQETANSHNDFLIKSTQNLLQYLVKNVNEPSTIEALKDLLKKYSEKNQFSIINIKASKRNIVGSISNGAVVINKNLTFPGNSSAVPKSVKKILHVTVSGGSYNPGTAPKTQVPSFYYGAYTAWSLVNDGTLGILKNFQINHFIFDCGAMNYNDTYATACFSKDKDKFGLAHISPATSAVTIAEMKLFKRLNKTSAFVGTVSMDDSISNKTLYPLFSRVIISSRYTFTLASLLLKALGWKKACVLYYNETAQRNQYSIFLKSAEQYGLEILNPESTRVILPDANRTDFKAYANNFQTIIDTQARLLVLILLPTDIFYVFEEFYDLGLRRGDLVSFVLVQGFLTMVTYTDKLKETGVPVISISGQNWVGETGKSVYSKIESLYKTVQDTYSCYSYDAGYFIANSLDYMINQGFDYYDPYQLNSVMRTQKFTGCTGTVSIDKNSNDRIMESFDISCNKIDKISGNVTAYKSGEFHPYSSTMLTIDSPIIYGDGTTNKPSDLRNQDSECPFPDKLVRIFTKGRILTFSICFGFALVSFVSTAYIWKKWWNINIEELKDRHEITLQDFIVQLTIGIEFFQFAAMGPDITPINSFLANLSDSFSLNLENILKLRNGVFWILIDGVFAAIILWLVLCLTILLRLDEKFPRLSLFRFLAWLADYLMPILGNLCFIPFISMCLNIFLCDQSIGENFTDSFLSQDCYYFCWKDDHLIYAILSFIALIGYEPLAVFCRPLWQELQHAVHIHTSPLFLMVKTVVQILFVVMNKTVKRAESTVHGALFAILMAAYIVFIFKHKPYNYPRLCWWQGLSLIGVVWLSVLSTISANVEGNYLIYFLLLCIGWILIAIFGLCVQRKKYPSLLYRKKGLDTTNLYKFAFAFGKQSKAALSKIAPNRSSGDSMTKDLSLIKPPH